ncbi:stage V sporulation protein AE [Marinisporobacter balticus]|uniref:Stage V sporulation protein AE n=1 Tax=Marinisporobacter balticus TaxID=2018667 RepID=A0A4R2KI39_9FIRM|nr:stage V sporulation protein AE [Marinisporobacter balticus]TCO70199.1 stage V sporulation protein AE [Marinisporobacter balticus]
MTKKRNVILVTDGDSVAQRAVEKAVKNIGARCISRSGGNPTPIQGAEIVELIKSAKYDPVVVMVDDKGSPSTAEGERALYEIANHPDIEVLGVIAVASNTQGVEGVKIDCSITCDGKIIKDSVNKAGAPNKGEILYGDTVDIIDKCNVPVIVGIGDIGKMDGKDDCEIGAPIITKAMEEILNRSGYLNGTKEEFKGKFRNPR